MLFNSIEFFIFLPIVFLLYWFATGNDKRLQNILIIVASYVFYGWWDWHFLFLIAFSSFVDFLLGQQIFKTESQKKKKLFLGISLGVNLGILGFFKYFNFFIDSFATALNGVGLEANLPLLQIILPVGISFYTFQTLSYSIDIYRNQLKPTEDPFAFFAFVSYFPQLVAGPIERASNLLPQFLSERTFNIEDAKDGLRQMLWGLFKKVVIADNCAMIVNEAFANPGEQSSIMLIIGAIFFAFQIYGDFSGYSDIAIGLSKLFGIKLMQNFAFPYFSRDIAEFWRRWHISLSSWFRDYLYIPLGGSRGGKGMTIRNVFAIFVVSGFWHGANWTFIVWGFLHALYYVPLLLFGNTRKHLGDINEGGLFPSLQEIFNMIITFTIVVIAWVFFRADSVKDAFVYLLNMFKNWNIPYEFDTELIPTFLLIGFLLFLEWLNRSKQHGLGIMKWKQTYRWSLYVLIIILIIKFYGPQQDFIYFQF